ncbi:MAG: diaminopropionate ammonia-lyase, partial [Candidatus Marinimicrobia bacterium]|nr:diaminopropionate ammonia-lyase [Candidatus Neomarinimicrobiota bacterium]
MINQYKHLIHSTRHFENLNIQAGSDYRYQDILSLESFELANKEISSWDSYESTPLHSLSDLASDSGVSLIAYKDESHRFSLKSFKALGGAYAVANLLLKKLKEQGIEAKSSDLIAGT